MLTRHSKSILMDTDIGNGSDRIVVEVRQMTERKSTKVGIDYFKIFELAPKFLWIIFFATIFCSFYDEIKYNILPNISSFNIAGFSATLKDDLASISKGTETKNNNASAFSTYLSPVQQRLISNRAQKLYRRLQETRILWVDVNVDNNADVRVILQKWGAAVDCAKSDSDAFVFLSNSEIDNKFYDLIITNHSDDTHTTNGTDFSNTLREKYTTDTPVILFSASRGNKETVKEFGVPENVFAATNRYDYLLHFIFDVLERGNTPYPANIQRYISSNVNSDTITGSGEEKDKR